MANANPVSVQAPGPNINFGTAPSGSTHISDANSLIAVIGTAANIALDLAYLIAAGCIVLSPGGFGQNSVQTGTSYTVQLADNAQEIVCTNAGAFTFNLPNNMPIGFFVNATQGGAGTVTATALSGATIHHVSSSATSAQYAQIKCVVIANSDGVHAVWAVMQVGA